MAQARNGTSDVADGWREERGDKYRPGLLFESRQIASMLSLIRWNNYN